MSDKFQQAKIHARSHIEWHFNNGFFPVLYPSIFKTEQLGAHKLDFDWYTAWKNSDHDHEAFEALKRYCSFQIRHRRKLPNELTIWTANVLDEILKPPARNSSGAKKKPKIMKIYLGLLIYNLCKIYDLNPTRNSLTMAKVCAVDAVIEAIKELPKSYNIKPSSYSGLVDAFYYAKDSYENVSK